MTYISSGIKALDAITLGWQKSDLILIVGVPAMGNTSLMVSMLNNIAIKQGIPTAVCSLQILLRHYHWHVYEIKPFGTRKLFSTK